MNGVFWLIFEIESEVLSNSPHTTPASRLCISEAAMTARTKGWVEGTTWLCLLTKKVSATSPKNVLSLGRERGTAPQYSAP